MARIGRPSHEPSREQYLIWAENCFLKAEGIKYSQVLRLAWERASWLHLFKAYIPDLRFPQL